MRTLRALRDAGSLVAASQRLHLTQSALSHQIRQIEELLGLSLFARKSRPLRVTDAGRRILAVADDVLPRLDRLERDLQRLARGESGRLHIAIECHSCFDWLLPTLDHYREAWPQVELDLTLAFPFQPLPALLRGDIDLVITSDPTDRPDIAYQPLFAYQQLLAVAPDHRLGRRRFVRPADIAEETLLTYPVERERLDIFRRFLTPAAIAPHEVRTCELTPLMLQLVASRRGVAALPNWALRQTLEQGSVRACALGRDGLWSTLYTAVRDGEAELPHMAGFLQHARQTCLALLPDIRPHVVDG